MGFGPKWRGVGLQRERGFYGHPVNRWSIKRSPNDTKLDRRSTGSKPRPHVKPRSIPRKFNTRSRRNVKRGRRRTWERRIAKRTTENQGHQIRGVTQVYRFSVSEGQPVDSL